MLTFVHIPKTGGTTVTSMLVSALSPSFHLGNEEALRRLQGMTESQRMELKLVYGHMPMGLHRLVSGCEYAAFLREPVDRVVSAYYHCKRTPGHPLFAQIRDGMTLEMFAQSMLLKNRQTRQLADFNMAGNDSGRYWYLDAQIRKSPQLLFSEACRNLSKFSFVGLYEQFEGDVRTLTQRFNLLSPDIPQLNVASNRPTIEGIPPSAVEKIRLAEELDIELYNYAKNILRGIPEPTRARVITG
jgi:hypothetical protein